MKRSFLACVPLTLSLCAGPALADAPPAAGPNFQVNQVFQGSQLHPDVAQDTAGDFVVVWIDQSTPNNAVRLRLFNASGAPKTDEIAVAPAQQISSPPRVAMTPLGDFAVVWEILGNVFLRRFDPRGRTPTIVFDPPGIGVSHNPDVAIDPAGNAYAVWAETHAGGDTIMLQRYGPDGFAVAIPEQVNLPASGTRDIPRIAADASGSLLITWNDTRGQGGFDVDVYARRYDAPSGTWGPEVTVNPGTTGFQEGGAPILFSKGDGAVVYNDFAAQQILVRRFDAQGSPTGAPIRLGDLDAAGPFTPAAEAGPNGTLVAWLKGDNLVHARFFDAFWAPLGAEFTPSTVTNDIEVEPSVSAGGAGSFAAVWTSTGVPVPTSPQPPSFPGRDGDGTGVFGQAFLSPGCAANAETLCLQNGRFQARVSWKNPFNTDTGTGKTLPLTGDTGAFWFFDPSNLEMMVKVLDGRLVNENFWVFYGSLSNVEYTLTLTDTVTGTSKSYHNPPLQFGSQADVAAFHSPLTLAAQDLEPPHPAPPVLPAASTKAAATCVSTPTSVCPQDRFRVEVDFVDPRNGSAGKGRAIQLTNDTGLFWFFGPENLELMVKVLDGTGVNGHFWVFYGALSDVEYTIKVTDTATGAQKTYHNPLHHLASGADITAFTAP